VPSNMNAGYLRWLVDAATSLLLLLPLAALTWTGYDPRLWWQRSETDVLPFATRWVVRVPIVSWYLLFWIVALCALAFAEYRGRIPYLALMVALVEMAYGLLRAGKVISPIAATVDPVVIAFALGQNALTEEVIFRGIPLWIAAVCGFSHYLAWQYSFVLASGIAFGLYHWQVSHRSRLYDTTVFGCFLGAVALWNGVASAILVHTIRNSLAIPFNQTHESMPRWRRVRALYAIGLFLIGVAGLGLNGRLTSGHSVMAQ
jgi:hypothetical protein